MIEVTIAEAKKRLSELVRLVEGGETVRIFRDGQPVAEIIPVERGKNPSAA
ncbi:type II toxin-antitoxin system Phd/YefM family antitoxin [Rhizobium sp. 21-4511-3d]